MRSIGKTPSDAVVNEYRKLSHRTAHSVWENLAEATVSGQTGNGEMRRFLKCKLKKLFEKRWKLQFEHMKHGPRKNCSTVYLVRERVDTDLVAWTEVSVLMQKALSGGRQTDLEEILKDQRFPKSRMK